MPSRRRGRSSNPDIETAVVRPGLRPSFLDGKKPGSVREKPCVAHFVRGWLLPNQSFIGNQITSPLHHKPLVICHHRLNEEHPFPNIPANPVVDELEGWKRRLEMFSYRCMKTLTPPATRKILDILNRSTVRLLHLHFLVDARFFLPVIRASRLPAVVSAYGYDVSSFPSKMFGVGLSYLRPLFSENTLFLAMSEDMKRDMLALGCPAAKIKVHYYGTDTDRFLFPGRIYEEKNDLRVLISGRLVPKKGHSIVLDALKILRDDTAGRQRFQLVVVGNGPLMESLRSRARTLGLDDAVVFRGHVAHESQDLHDLYRFADLFTSPSLTVNGEKEGIPGTLIEAMASGLPVVSTRHAGIPEVVTDDVNGILVEEGSAEAVAAALKRLAGDVALRRKFGHAAMVKATKDLSLREKTQDLEAIYENILSRNVQPATTASS